MNHSELMQRLREMGEKNTEMLFKLKRAAIELQEDADRLLAIVALHSMKTENAAEN